MVTIVMLFPVVGFLADVYFGRYKAVTISMGMMWISLAITSGVILLVRYISLAFTFIEYNFGGIGDSGYGANVVQVGLDQLP